MKHLRLLLVVGAVLAIAPPAALAASRKPRAQSAVVLRASGRRLTVVGPLLAARTYTIAGTVPSNLAFGAVVSMRPSGRSAADVRRTGNRTDVSYLATVAATSRGSITVRVARSTLTYRSAGADTVSLPSGTLRRGSETLLIVSGAPQRKPKVTVKRAAGAPVHADRRASGLITAIAGKAKRINVLMGSGLTLAVALPRSISKLSSLTECKGLVVYYRRKGGRSTATMVALSNRKPAGHCGSLRGGDGFVTDVASNDHSLTVSTPTHHKVTLLATSKAMRRAIDAVSVTDYVTFTYARSGSRSELATLSDTSASNSGEITAVSPNEKLVTVDVKGRGALTLHTSGASALAGLKVGDAVDVDYYRTAQGQTELVNIDNQGPATAGGNGGGRVTPGGSGSSGGSAGGSGGSAGS